MVQAHRPTKKRESKTAEKYTSTDTVTHLQLGNQSPGAGVYSLAMQPALKVGMDLSLKIQDVSV